MEPRNIGRALGIGIRVVGRMAGQRVAGSAPPVANQSQPQQRSVSPAQTVDPVRNQAQAVGRAAVETGRNMSKGLGGLLRPFRRVGGIVWLEVTGTFFLLFAVLFALRLWQNWPGISAVSRDFAVGAAAVFLYLGVSSFWRARRR